ncbi:putative glycosyl hydrolase family protein [Eutypa lata UCREL1]|uniref:Putative glycosyl hydrolase family protein n=1 Tax=Eutypa lata (strain UCR-EL1) TaxID=1287681 RepID=M7TFH4_EUTLA|nr:putative glycosyl hydrolase family protein [Eutypa lata UCREL1]
MPAISLEKSQKVHEKIDLLISQLVGLKDSNQEFVYRLPNGGTLDTKSWNGWDWTHGVGLYGIWKYYELTGRPDLLQIIEDWFQSHFKAGGTENNINTMSVFLTLAYVYEKTGNQTYLPWLEAWAEWAMHDLPRTQYDGMQHITYVKTNAEQLWDDTLMITALPLAKIGKLLNRPHYVEEALRQICILIQYLFDHKTGLFFHGWKFDTAAEKEVGHNFAEARWARGNSWITIVVPEMLELLENDSSSPAMGALRSHLLNTLEAQCRQLARLQDVDSGLWRTLLDHPVSEGSYLEASATAGFAYGILKARRKRYLAADIRVPDMTRTYDDVAESAMKGVLDNVSPEGELLQTSFGTGMGDTLQFYKDIAKTAMPYGQAMAIMALVEYARKLY